MNVETFFDRFANLLVKDGKGNRIAVSAILLLSILPILMLATYSYWQSRQDLTRLALSQRDGIAYLAATTLKEKLDRLTDLSVSLASRVRLSQLVGENRWDEAVQLLSGVPRDFPIVDRAFLADVEGTLRADNPSLPEARGKNFASRDWYRGVGKDWKPYISEFYQRDAEPRHNIVAAAAPIKSAKGESVGILVLQVKLDSLLDWSKDIDVGREGVVFVVDKTGKMAAHPKHDPQGQIADYSGAPAVQKALRGAKGIGVFFNPRSNRQDVIAYQPVAGYGWGVIVEQPASAAFAERNETLRFILIAYGFISLFGLCLAYLILGFVVRLKQAHATSSRLASIVEFSDDAIIGITLEGRFSAWNKGAETICGFVTEEVMGRSVSLLVPPDQVNELPKMVDKIRGGEVVRNYETVWVKKDGQRVDVSLTVSPMRDAAGKIVGASVIGRNVAERKRFRDELQKKNRELEQKNRLVQEASRLKSEFLSNMSHELRTPLNAIIGFAQLMHDGKVGPVSANHKEYLGDILTSGQHLLELINDVLELAKVESGKMEFSPEPIRLSKLVDEVRTILLALGASKRLTIVSEVSPQVEELVIDPAKLKQVLYNYLSNAIKFTPVEGHITIRAVPQDDDHFRLEVEDTGIGIPAEQIDKLFTEFKQLDSGTGKRHQGTGLGLALARKIVEAQDGRVGFQGATGRGSLFFAVLPRSAAQVVKIQPREIVAEVSGRGPRILVIEDNASDLDWLAKTLSQAGYIVDSATTGAEAVAKARRTAYNAILLDLILPDTLGWSVLRSIRGEDTNRHAPVIVVTVVTEKETAKGFLLHDYLSKPVSAATLLNSLRRAGVIADGAGKRVLVVDDDPAALKVARTALESSGYEAVCHNNAASALAAAAQSAVDAVVLDLLMPEIDGFEFLERFRNIAARRGTPVIVWTGKAITAEERERLKNSAHSITLKGQGGIDAVLRELRHQIASSAQAPLEGNV